LQKEFNCPVEATLSIIGGKYKAIILWHLLDATLRFSELRRLIPSATPKMLTQQLRDLEHEGIISRKVYPVVPPKTEYTITSYGESMRGILVEMCSWGKEYMSNNDSDESDNKETV